MKQLKQFLSAAFMLFLTISALGQQEQTGYNPFVPVNLDDEAKLPYVPVVESSYHLYSITGDAIYTVASTFVWYVENGTMGTYDPDADVWVESTGSIIELTGDADNNSQMWVRWNDAAGGSIGYIAAYERSSDSCIVDNQISGFKHDILVPPEIWFLVDVREECSDQIYSITAQLNELRDNSFPYTLSYTYPDYNGNDVQTDTIFTAADLNASNQLTWDLNAVQDGNATIDETYTISLDLLRDQYGSLGKIAPLGAPDQYGEITIEIFHLPQTAGMNMD